MQVSVIIINYNTFDLTCACIESVMVMTTGVTYEIVLVDNASTEKDADLFLERFPTIALVKSTVNTGFAGGNNLGIAQAKGDYIVLLNSDTLLKNDAIASSVAFLDRDPSVAVVGGKLEYPDGRIQHNCQRFPSISYKLFELLRLQKVFPSRGSKVLLGAFFDHSTVVYPDWIWGTFFMFRRNLLRDLPEHKLADTFFMYGEDVQWCMEFRKLGYRIGFDPEARILHYGEKSGGAKVALMQKNGEHFMSMYYSRVERTAIRILDSLL